MHGPETVIRRNQDERVWAGNLDQAPDDFINPSEVPLDPIPICSSFFLVVPGMLVIDYVPQLVLNAIGAPEILKERVPFVPGY